MTGKILLVHKRWMLIAKGGTNPLTGSTYCFTGKNINFVSQEKYFFWKISSHDRNFFLWQEICYCDRKLLPVTENVFLWQENFLCCESKFLPVTARFVLCQEISSCDRNFLPVTGIFLPVAQKLLHTISFWGRNIILVAGTFCNILFHLILKKMSKNHTPLS